MTSEDFSQRRLVAFHKSAVLITSGIHKDLK